MYQVSLRHYPNNEVRVTAVPVPGRRFSFGDENENDSQNESSSDRSDVAQEWATGELPPLSLGENSELSVLRPGFGLSPARSEFSLYGRRQMQRAAGAVEKLGLPIESGLFLTGTLAGSTDESLKAIADWSGWIVDRLKSWMSKIVGNRHEFYCWERQKRGALHLHYFVSCPDLATGDKILRGFHQQWRKLLLSVSRKAGVDTFERAEGGSWKDDASKPRTDAQRVAKSVAAYMSKYLSKGGLTDSSNKKYCPSRWYGISRPLLALTRSLTSEIVKVFPNCVTARKYLVEAEEFVTEHCEVVHKYDCRQVDARVILGYHDPQQFEPIQKLFDRETQMEVFELADGSTVKPNISVRRHLQHVVDVLPPGEFMDVEKASLGEFLSAERSVLGESELSDLIARLTRVSFIDTGLSSLTLGCCASESDLRRAARTAWNLRQLLANLARRLYEETPEEESYQSQLPAAKRVIQLTLWGDVAVEMVNPTPPDRTPQFKH